MLKRLLVLAALAVGSISHAWAQTYPGIGSPINAAAFPYQADPTGTVDSTTAIQNAINALPARGGDVVFPCGTYKVAPLSIGNGSSSVQSTKSGMRLIGQGGTVGPFFGSSETPCVTFLYNGGAGNNLLTINGPLQGWGIENIAFNGAGANTAGTCLQIISGAFGFTRNLSFQGCPVSLQSTTWNAIPAGLGNADSIHNTYVNTSVTVPNSLNAVGIQLTGTGTVANTDYSTFINTAISLPTSGTNQALSAIYHGFSDSNQWYDTHIFGGLTSNIVLLFDYTITSGFPTNNFFWGLDPSGSLAPPVRYQNNGSPGGGALPQYIYGLVRANGAGFPAIAGICAQDPSTAQFCGTTSGSASLVTSATGGHLALTSNTTPTLTAGCNGAGSSVVGNDLSGTVTGSTAAATSCTLTFATAYGAAPNCVAMGISAPLTGTATPATGTLVVNFASLTLFKWSYFCPGN